MIEIKRKAPEQATQQAPRRDVGAMYQAAQAFHTRHSPPQAGAEYWDWTLTDLRTIANQHDKDPLITALLSAALADLEREHKRLQTAQDGA